MSLDDDLPAPRPVAKPSQVPSWAMLGFALGALFVLALPSRRPEPPPPAPPPAPAPLGPPRISTVEAVFAAWGKYAVWEHDHTEIALWNADAGAFADCFEVLRVGDRLYFRSIPALTRPVLRHGVSPDSPLEFTESEAQRRQWLHEAAEENWREIGEALRTKPAPK